MIRYRTKLEVVPITNEATSNFTSRTDFTYKTLSVSYDPQVAATGWSQRHGSTALGAADGGLTLVAKLMHVWDQLPDTVSGTLFIGIGMKVQLTNDMLTVSTFTGTDASNNPVFTPSAAGGVKIVNYHCNQLAIVISGDSNGNTPARVQLGTNPGTVVAIPELTMATVKSWAALDTSDDAELVRVGPVNAKVWDIRLYGEATPPTDTTGWWPGRELTATEIDTIGTRCGRPGDYTIPESANVRYPYGMGGLKLNPEHKTQAYSSGVYVSVLVAPFQADVSWTGEPDFVEASEHGHHSTPKSLSVPHGVDVVFLMSLKRPFCS